MMMITNDDYTHGDDKNSVNDGGNDNGIFCAIPVNVESDLLWSFPEIYVPRNITTYSIITGRNQLKHGVG